MLHLKMHYSISYVGMLTGDVGGGELAVVMAGLGEGGRLSVHITVYFVFTCSKATMACTVCTT